MHASQRHPSLELLRTAAVLAVVGVHVAAALIVAQPGTQGSAWWVANILDALCRWCVPVFVMISGALLLGKPADEPALAFYRRRTTRLLWPTLLWTLAYLGVTAATTQRFTPLGAALSVLHGTPYYHLWFLYMLPGLYLLTPVLRRLVATRTRPQLWAGALTACALAALDAAFGWRDASFVTSSLPYLGYFLLGHLLFTQPQQLPARVLSTFAALAGAGIALGAGLYRPSLNMLYAYTDPLVLVLSICIFKLSLRPLTGRAARLADAGIRLAPLSFGIYLIHPLWLLGLARVGVSGTLGHPALGIPLTTLAAFALSAAATALLLRVPVLRLALR